MFLGFSIFWFIIAIIFAYLVIALGVASVAGYYKNSVVPTKITSNRYAASVEYTSDQKKVRDRWEVIQVTSLLWPFQIIAALGWGIGYGGYEGIVSVAGLSSKHAAQVRDRKVIQDLERRKAEVEAKKGTDLEHFEDKSTIQSLDQLIAQRQPIKAVTR